MDMNAARRWRRSRDLETLGMALFWLRLMMTDKPTYEELRDSFGGYEADS